MNLEQRQKSVKLSSTDNADIILLRSEFEVENHV